MPNYRRTYTPGGTYFFTLTLQDRRRHWLTDHIDTLRDSVARVRQARPFQIDGWVVLPEHMHAIWTLPEGDSDYSGRWRAIKKQFAKCVTVMDTPSLSQHQRNERAVWQRRFWEHEIRDERDFRRHMDYLHFNPVKHGWVGRVIDWPYSSFHRAVRQGLYPEDWGGGEAPDFQAGE